MTFQEMLKERLSPTDWQRLQAFTASMEPTQRAAMMQFIAQRETHAPAIGDEAPDFELPLLGRTERVRLSAFRHHKPVALIFGSFT
jgi:hypothetical protein